MILEDKHISYLILVDRGMVKLWWNPVHTISKYVCGDWASGKVEIDQTVAAQMHAMGSTRISTGHGSQQVVLTERGRAILVDEEEAWL